MNIIRKTRVNHEIRAPELRVKGPLGENFGVMPLSDALKKAEESGFDLIEISPTAMPPVAVVMDYGKYQYEENKKLKAVKAKTQTVEVKSVQIKIGTGEHDLSLKAKKASEWLKEGNRVKIELFLSGRSKYMDGKFLNERLNRILPLITEEYKTTEPAKRGPKGPFMVIEKK